MINFGTNPTSRHIDGRLESNPGGAIRRSNNLPIFLISMETKSSRESTCKDHPKSDGIDGDSRWPCRYQRGVRMHGSEGTSDSPWFSLRLRIRTWLIQPPTTGCLPL